MRLFRTSVKEDLNVGPVFQHLAEAHVAKVKAFMDDDDEEPQVAARIGSRARPFITAAAATGNAGSRPRFMVT